MLDSITAMGTMECFDYMAVALDGLEQAFGITIKRVAVDGEDRLPKDKLAQIDFGISVFGEQPAALSGLFRNLLSKDASSLKAVFVGWVGVDAPFFDTLRARGVKVMSSPGVNAGGIAWNMVAGLLMIERRMMYWLSLQRQKIWGRLPEALDPSRRDVAGLTAVLYGFGHIGRETAKILRGLGMHVVGVRRSPMQDGEEPVDEMVMPDRLEEVAARADWLLNCAPLTKETRGAITRAVIRALPRGSGFANVGRGGTVDEHALVEALQDGHLRGAYLDVFETEPLPPESPLWDLPNVIVTPHNSSGAFGNRERSVNILRSNLSSWLEEYLGRSAGSVSMASRL